LIGRSVPKDHGPENPELLAPCLRHVSEGCPRCDGSSFRPRRVCEGCGKHAKNLTPERTARSWTKARALPRYCPECNPRRRNSGAALVALQRMGA
jgi:hypothetical protein